MGVADSPGGPMDLDRVTRRRFVGGISSALGLLSLKPRILWPQQGQNPRPRATAEEYDAMAKLANNENPYGPPESVLKAMTDAFKYANRYGSPDGGIVDAIAAHHGVKNEQILIGEGSSELLDISDAAFTREGRKVVGADPTYATIFQYAAGTKSEGILIPLKADYTQDIPAMI